MCLSDDHRTTLNGPPLYVTVIAVLIELADSGLRHPVLQCACFWHLMWHVSTECLGHDVLH